MNAPTRTQPQLQKLGHLSLYSRCFSRVANPENCTLFLRIRTRPRIPTKAKSICGLFLKGKVRISPPAGLLCSTTTPVREYFFRFCSKPTDNSKIKTFYWHFLFVCRFYHFPSYIPLLQPISVPKYEAEPTQVESHIEGEDERDALASRRLEKTLLRRLLPFSPAPW